LGSHPKVGRTDGQPRQGIYPAGAVVCCQNFGKRTCKPNSVVCGHSSRRRVAADTHQRPTRRFQRVPEPLERIGPMRSAAWLQAAASLPIWSCSMWGLPCPRPYGRSGALLPHHFTLTGLAVQAIALRASPWRGQKTRPGWRYLFCGTCRPRALKPASRTLSGTLPCGVRTFLPRHPPKREPAATARSSCQYQFSGNPEASRTLSDSDHNISESGHQPLQSTTCSPNRLSRNALDPGLSPS